MDKEFEGQAIALKNEWKAYLSSLRDKNILQILDRNIFDDLIKAEQAIIKELPQIKESMERVKAEVNKIM